MIGTRSVQASEPVEVPSVQTESIYITDLTDFGMDESYIAELNDFANAVDNAVKQADLQEVDDGYNGYIIDLTRFANFLVAEVEEGRYTADELKVEWQETKVMVTEALKEGVKDNYLDDLLNFLSVEAELFKHVITEHGTLDYSKKSYLEHIVHAMGQLDKEDPRGTCESLVKTFGVHIHACE